jgi:hypothetical protein
MSGSLAAAIPNSPLVEAGTGNVTVAWRAWLLVLQRRTGGTVGTDAAGNAAFIAIERGARIAADQALQRALELEAEARIAADAAEEAARAAADAWLVTYVHGSAAGLQIEIDARKAADLLLVPIAQLCSMWAGCDLSFLPTSDPGSGRPWLNGTHLVVGTDPTVTNAIGLEDGSGQWLLEDGSGAWIWG